MRHFFSQILSVTLLLGVSAMGFASPTHARELSPYESKIQGLTTLQSAAPSANEFSLSVAPQVGWDAGLESLRPPPGAMYRMWDMKVAWRDVNPQRGVFDWSILDRRIALVESWGGRPFLVLGLTPQWAAENPGAGDPRWGAGSASPPTNIGDWNEYVRAVAGRYGGRIAGYELWNEANLTTFWQGSAGELFAMAQSAYGIIKASNPSAVVAAPSITTRLRGSAARFTSAFAGEVADNGAAPFDTWTIHSYPNGDAGRDFDTGQNFPRMAATQRADDIISWQNALVDALGPDSPALGIGIYDTEVNYGLKGPGIRPGVDWSTEDGNQLMDYTYADSRLLGITATFWYEYTATDYSLLGVQWSNAGGNQLSATWDSLRASGPSSQRFNSVSSPLFLSRNSDYVIPVFKSCFIRPGTSCAGDKLGEANLSGANLSDMDFTGANLQRARLAGATLNNTNFTDAFLKRAVFSGATGANTQLGARSLADANFSRVRLENPKATGTSFLRSNWTKAYVEKGDFSSSNFYKSNFEGASIKNTDMRATKLRGTSWKGATVSGSEFKGAVGNEP
ncbi:MAG TPA: hypothetical protein DCY63_04690 [Acidimicrobiaceae bacterium]|nr:hypothetical protein [Acidimicrobiaceae bacterium]